MGFGFWGFGKFGYPFRGSCCKYGGMLGVCLGKPYFLGSTSTAQGTGLQGLRSGSWAVLRFGEKNCSVLGRFGVYVEVRG